MGISGTTKKCQKRCMCCRGTESEICVRGQLLLKVYSPRTSHSFLITRGQRNLQTVLHKTYTHIECCICIRIAVLADGSRDNDEIRDGLKKSIHGKIAGLSCLEQSHP